MNTLIKNVLFTNINLKICSLLIGFCIWSFIGALYMQTNTIQIPVCCYNTPEDKEIIIHPTSAIIQIQGKRADLNYCTDLAMHINAESLEVGEHKIKLSENQLFLPKHVKLLRYKPLIINLTVNKKINNSNC